MARICTIILLTIKNFLMQKISFRKISVLGLILMAASAVTAAIIPNKAKTTAEDLDRQGNLVNSTVASGTIGKTCGPKIDLVSNCISTVGSNTTGVGVGSSDGAAGDSTVE
jgi:hypothetical protein